MPRLVVKRGDTLRRVATVDLAKHDGSLSFSLVRAGKSNFGWETHSQRTDFDTLDYGEPRPKTTRITIHTSGRINYHGTLNPGVCFVPCLLDLTQPLTVVIYMVPSVNALDSIESLGKGDLTIELGIEAEQRFGFEFCVVPANLPPLNHEIWRCVVEGKYALACALLSGTVFPIPHGMPEEVFQVIRPSTFLPEQAIPEEEAFLRFQQLMHGNQVRQALKLTDIPEPLHEKIIENAVREGRGIQGPNAEGVWEVVCSVVARIRPALHVQFVDARYRAEAIDFTPTDRRLERVRVRFKVYDEVGKQWVKQPVAITSLYLSAEL